jgi:cytochrome c oxidase subunit 1
VFELHYPHMIERMRAESHIGRHREVGAVTQSTTANK